MSRLSSFLTLFRSVRRNKSVQGRPRHLFDDITSTAMARAYITVNDTQISFHRVATNSLTDKARSRLGFDLSIAVVMTDFATLNLDIISPNTFSLIFYVADTPDVSRGIIAPICIGSSWSNSGMRLDAYKYGSAYTTMELPFEGFLKGSLGCTAAGLMGMYLFKEWFNREVSNLGVLSIIDRTAPEKLDKLGFTVADDHIIQFCSPKTTHHVNAVGDSDCDQFVECIGQVGQRCDLNRIKCLAGA